MAVFKVIVGIFIRSAVFAYSELTAITVELCKHIYLKVQELRKKNLPAYRNYRAIGIIQFFTAFFLNMLMMLRQYYHGEMFRASPLLAICISILFVIDSIIVVSGIRKTRKMKDEYMMA